MILTTITESIVIDEEAQTIRVKLKPVFEHLRQLKLQDKGCFTAEIKNLNGTLKSRSDRAKQALNNEHSDVNELEDYRTRKKLLNTKIEPNLDGSLKLMSTGGLEPPQLSPHAPQACVSTIPPHRRKLLVNIVNVERLLVVEVLRTLSQNVTFSHLSPCLLALNGSTDKAIRFVRSPSARKQFGRVPHRQKLFV